MSQQLNEWSEINAEIVQTKRLSREREPLEIKSHAITEGENAQKGE